MIDRTLLRGIVAGGIGTGALIALLAALGHLPRRTEPRFECACPDSGAIVSPRSIEPKEGN